MGALAVGEEDEGDGDRDGEEGKLGYGEGEKMRAWFVGKLGTCFSLMGLGEWKGVRVVLGRWLWWEWFLGERGGRLWEVRTQFADGQERAGEHARVRADSGCVV